MKTGTYSDIKISSYNIEQQINKLTNIEFNDASKITGSILKISIIFLVPTLWFIANYFLFFSDIFYLSYIGNTLLFYIWRIPYTEYIFIFYLLLGVILLYARIFNILRNFKPQVKLHESVLGLYVILKNTTYLVEELDELYHLIQEIHRRILNIRKLYIFGFIFTKEGKEKLKEIGILSTKITLNIIYNLRSDLAIRLSEQQSTLKSAKSEVSAHIRGTDELNQVSELQRQRLDKQIEQFEELQRVLVKV